MRIYYEPLVPNSEMEAVWKKRLAWVEDAVVGPEFWRRLHHDVKSWIWLGENDGKTHTDGRYSIKDFHYIVTNSAVTIHPLYK